MKEKNPAYYEFDRSELLPFMPATITRLLDVGCGGGNFGGLVKADRRCEVWGIEPNAEACARAARRIDHVHNGTFGAVSGRLPQSSFDCITFNDVLEHMVEPAEALAAAKKLLAPQGWLIASVPNVRFFPVMFDLLTHGEWRYVDAGVLDETHLRYFTFKSFARFIRDAGYEPARLEGILRCGGMHIPLRSILLRQSRQARQFLLCRLLAVLTLGRTADMEFRQIVAVARVA